MRWAIEHEPSVWELASRQHGVVARSQLLELGMSPRAIDRRIARGRLHPLWRGVYAVGRPGVSRFGRWLAGVLACGPEAVLSHGSASALYEIGEERGAIEVSVPFGATRRRAGIEVHRRRCLTPADVTRRHGIPVTTPAATLVDLATQLAPRRLEAAVNEADKLGLITLPALRRALEGFGSRRGAPALTRLLDGRAFRLTDSQLERRFLVLVRRAGLPLPETRQRVNGFRVDFYWPDLGLVVETDGLTYHRTPAQQAKDRLRDQTHAAAGLTTLRFTHEQIRHGQAHVGPTLARVMERLQAARPEPAATAGG